MLAAGIFEWDEDDESGSFVEGLFEGLTEMTAHYSPSVEESTHQTAPRWQKEPLLVKEKETRRDKPDPGVSVAPAVDSLPVTHSVIIDDERACVSEEREPKTVQSPLEVLHKATNFETVTSSLDQHPTHTSATSLKEERVQLQKDQHENIGEQLPPPEDLPAAPDKKHFTGAPTHSMPIEAATCIEKDSADVTEESLNIDSSRDLTEEELCRHAVDSPEGGGDSQGTTGISAVPQVGSLGSAAVCLLTVWGCACLVTLTKGISYLERAVHLYHHQLTIVTTLRHQALMNREQERVLVLVCVSD